MSDAGTVPEGAEVNTNTFGAAWSQNWLGRPGVCYTPERWQRSHNIPVHRLRQIFLWPLVLRLTDLPVQPSPVDVGVEASLAQLRSSDVWKPVADLADHAPAIAAEPGLCSEKITAADQIARYGEFVYFHDFVQSVLFRPATPDDDRVPFWLFRRCDIATAEVKIGERVFRPTVDRCNLYLARTGAVVLVVEIDFGFAPQVKDRNEKRSLTLADALDFGDRVRRSYTPFFHLDDGLPPQPGGMVNSFVWQDADGGAIGPCPPNVTFETECRQIGAVDSAGQRSAPMVAPWRQLLEPLTVAGYEPVDRKPQPDLPVWRHVVDERVPVMSFVSLTGAAEALQIPPGKTAFPHWKTSLMDKTSLRAVSRGDWIRLCYLDSSGGQPLPYSPTVFEDFEERCCYDRYFPSDATSASVRFMFSGYHFAAVGSGNFFDTEIVHHFRRHYFQMALILQLEMATLLATSSRMSMAARCFGRCENDAGSEREFIATLLSLKKDFLDFVHLFRFTGLSNQLQATEIFSKWRDAMGMDAMFKDVQTELEVATQFQLAIEQRKSVEEQSRLASEQRKLAQSSHRLSVMVGATAVVGLTFAFLGMNVVVDQKLLGLDYDETVLARNLLVFFITLGLFSWAGIIVAGVFFPDETAARQRSSGGPLDLLRQGRLGLDSPDPLIRFALTLAHASFSLAVFLAVWIWAPL